MSDKLLEESRVKQVYGYDKFGLRPLLFSVVVDYFRKVYATDITKELDVTQPTLLFNVPILPYLLAQNSSLREKNNGDFFTFEFSDFKYAPSFIRPHLRELIEVFGVVDGKGKRFCLFTIDWKDENGKFKEKY